MIIAADGIKATAHTGGRAFVAADPTIVFLHGAGMDHSVWGGLPRWFAARGRSVLALDLPGHGRSPGAPFATIAENAEWLVASLRRLGLARAALVGHSMGSAIALEAAARAPDGVNAVALFGAALKMPVHPAMLASAKGDGITAIAMMLKFGFAPAAQMGAAPFPGLSLVGLGRRVLEAARPGVLAADLKACDAWDGEPAAEALRRFCTVVIGEKDRMTPPGAGHALAARIDGAQIAGLDGVGHMAPMEAPEACRKALIEAL